MAENALLTTPSLECSKESQSISSNCISNSLNSTDSYPDVDSISTRGYSTTLSICDFPKRKLSVDSNGYYSETDQSPPSTPEPPLDISPYSGSNKHKSYGSIMTYRRSPQHNPSAIKSGQRCEASKTLPDMTQPPPVSLPVLRRAFVSSYESLVASFPKLFLKSDLDVGPAFRKVCPPLIPPAYASHVPPHQVVSVSPMQACISGTPGPLSLIDTLLNLGQSQGQIKYSPAPDPVTSINPVRHDPAFSVPDPLKMSPCLRAVGLPGADDLGNYAMHVNQ